MQGGVRQNTRNYNEGIDRERGMFELGLSAMVQHHDLVQGDLVSLKQSKIVPLDPSLEFAGIIENVCEDRGKYMASVMTRGAVVVHVRGLLPDTPSGAKVYALPAAKTQIFTIEEAGTLVGEVLAIESRERGIAIVGVRLPTDTRRFELAGNR